MEDNKNLEIWSNNGRVITNDDELNDGNQRSKYDKISTKKKYGW